MARMNWLGPAIITVGVAVAGVGVYAMVTGRPEPGAEIDRIAIGSEAELVVRGEADGNRNFVELHEHGELKWRALTPPYAGRRGAPGIAWNDTAISVRVIRDGRAEIFALARANAAKLGSFKLSPGKGAVTKQSSGPVTLTDHERSYELVEGAGWRQLVAFELTSGEGVWLADLAATPIDDAKLENGILWITQAGVTRGFRAVDGREHSSDSPTSL